MLALGAGVLWEKPSHGPPSGSGPGWRWLSLTNRPERQGMVTRGLTIPGEGAAMETAPLRAQRPAGAPEVWLGRLDRSDPGSGTHRHRGLGREAAGLL